jgi:hypothetical protein
MYAMTKVERFRRTCGAKLVLVFVPFLLSLPGEAISVKNVCRRGFIDQIRLVDRHTEETDWCSSWDNLAC